MACLLTSAACVAAGATLPSAYLAIAALSLSSGCINGAEAPFFTTATAHWRRESRISGRVPEPVRESRGRPLHLARAADVRGMGVEWHARVLVWRVPRGGAPLADHAGGRQDPVSARSHGLRSAWVSGLSHTWRDDTSGRYDAAVHEAATRVEHPPTILESAVRSERITVAVLLSGVSVACWAWIVVMARDMYGSMSGASRWMMTPSWDAPHLFLLWTMWAVMMIGMMLPSAAPAILMFGLAARRRQVSGRRPDLRVGGGIPDNLGALQRAGDGPQRILGELAPPLPDDGDDQCGRWRDGADSGRRVPVDAAQGLVPEGVSISLGFLIVDGAMAGGARFGWGSSTASTAWGAAGH